MKSKGINLFGNKTIIQNQGVKYSKLLEQFIEPYMSDFADTEYYEDIFEFAINAWNFGNLKMLLPKEETDAILNSVKKTDINLDLLKRMIYSKTVKFKDYDSFIVDFEIKETSGEPILSVVTQAKDDYLASMLEELEDEHSQEDFEENYINRSAIILKPLQPSLNWYSNLHPDVDETIETKTYLLSEDIEDVEAWLRKNFDKLFILELEERHTNKKQWPQNRNYRMFKEWFQVELSTGVYDLEKEPISKSL
ncbi:hypothetical protein OQZ33_00270 [Pedobacter sp. MC2016-05]|uniref:hypothetical protein n=1 Tax=Pedobacter sp. MC2016-05 TaxID=2994474 RepID=UPI002247D439|nr:hypothetical protein [Pedobacter sp. MC2016-05]MCX2472754.1 hypothetical protein [Pedobacter sp. MC2016-05]